LDCEKISNMIFYEKTNFIIRLEIMKKTIFIFLAFYALSFQVVKSENFYIEGQLNYTQVDDLDNSGNSTLGNYTFNYNATNKYESDTSYGFEIGAKNISESNLRVGFSYSKTKIKLKSLSGTGNITDGNNTLDFGVSATRADLDSIGLTFDNDVTSYSLNAYYDLDTNSTFTPYVGVGLGEVDIENANDKELSTSLYLGGRHSIDDKMYVGIKGAYTMIDGPSDQIGLSYDDITQKSVSLIVGYNF